MAFVVRLKNFYPVLRFLGALFITWTISQVPVNYFEALLYDARVSFSPTPNLSDKIITVAIDNKSLSMLKNHEASALDIKQSLKQISEENPEAIMVLLEQHKNIFPQNASIYLATDQLIPLSAPIMRDNITFAGDKVTRRLMISYEGQKTLQTKLSGQTQKIRGSFQNDGSEFTYIRYAPKGSFKPLSLIDIRDGRFPKGTFVNKIVIVGNDSEQDSEDYILTPYSHDPLAMSKLEAQANIINTLIQNNGVAKSSKWLDFIITALAAYLTVMIVWSAKPIKGIILLFIEALGFTLFAYILFAGLSFWINITHPLLSIFVSYYFFIPYRLIAENRRSWELQEKNRLLTQVEELKTNFMSMMSHDLKTPLARIQGMAETALHDSSKLDKTQKEALKTIIHSTDELNHFIGSILDLSRIEGKEMKLRKTSRDLNTLIQEVITKQEFAAAKKGIQLKTDLEPLFSIKMDADLVKQVIANLIENAIKYSPENTTVTITTKEAGDHIEVAVQDQGQGISKADIDNIFLKFYRSKQAKASPIKGSGLGLYLAKYFVELHNGKISVESQHQKGSTFRVQLPI